MALYNESKVTSIYFGVLIVCHRLCDTGKHSAEVTLIQFDLDDRPNVCDNAYTLLHDVTFSLSTFKDEIIQTIISQAI